MISLDKRIIDLTLGDVVGYLEPMLRRIEKAQENLSGMEYGKDKVYSDTEASQFLKVSKKKLQNLRNALKIAFIRENDGRRILYKHEHLMEYLKNNEIKKRK